MSKSVSSSSSSNPKFCSPNRVIGFIDIDAFECQVWLRQPDNSRFRGIPCVVANSSGLILAATYEAKALGISRDKTPRVPKAMKLCPNLHVFWKRDKWGKQDQTMCRQATFEIEDCIIKYCSQFGPDIKIEMSSCDEVYLDLSAEITRGMEMRDSNPRRRYANIQIPDNIYWERQKYCLKGPFSYYRPQALGVKTSSYYQSKNDERLIFGAIFLNRLCLHLAQETGFTSSAGVGCNKLVAKVGCGLNKPNKITVCGTTSFERISGMAKKVPIQSIPGLGGPTGARLMEKFGVSMMSEIVTVNYQELENEFGVEKAKEISGWCAGVDNQPVENKVIKDQFRCKKSSKFKEILNLKTLSEVLANLRNECSVLLQEEKSRHNRTTDKICVEFCYIVHPGTIPKSKSKSKGIDKEKDRNISGDKDNTKSNSENGSENFDISTPDKINKLPETVIYYLKTKENFDPQRMKITELAFVLKNFKQLGNSSPTLNDELISGLQTHMRDLNLQNPRQNGYNQLPSTLRVQTKSNSCMVVPTFRHKSVGSFRTAVGRKYLSGPESTKLPKLPPPEKLKKLIGAYLGTGFEQANLLVDHIDYYEFKHECFVKWLNEEYKPDQGQGEKADFVAFSGRIADPLKTPINQQFGHWTIYAMNVNNTIYIWDEKVPNPQGKVNPTSFYGIYFENFVVAPDGKVDEINECDKIYLVNEVNFGKHKLLLCTNMDAVSGPEDEWTQVVLFRNKYDLRNHQFYRMRQRNLWVQMAVSGAKRMLLGTRDQNGILEELKDYSADEYAATLEDTGSFTGCYDFQNRLLDFIKLHLPKSDLQLVKRFSWSQSKCHSVLSETVPLEEVRNLVVPRLYCGYFSKTTTTPI